MKLIIYAVFLIIIYSLNEGFVFADNIYSRPGGCPEGRPCPRPPENDVGIHTSGDKSPTIHSGGDVQIRMNSALTSEQFCCNSEGEHICRIPLSLAIGSPCKCQDQEEGVVCN